MSYNNKKFLDANGVTQIVGLLDDYATNETLSTVVNSVQTALDQKYSKPVTGIPASDIADGVIPVADNALSDSSENAVQNKIVKGALDGKAPVILNSAVGNPVAFSDGADGLPIQSLKVHLLPRQEGSGDASPENVRNFIPWNGVDVFSGGKNLIPTGTVEFTRAKKYYFDKVLPAGTYTLSALVTSTDTDDSRCLARFWMNEDPVGSDMYFTKDSRKSKTVTIEQPFNSIFLYASNGYIAAEGDTASFADMQLEVGSSASAYEPYKPIAETDIAFPSPVYGGTLDVVSGVLTVEWTIKALNEWYTFNRSTSYEHPFFYGSFYDRKPGRTTDFFCDVFKKDTTHIFGSTFGNGAEDLSIAFSGDTGSQNIYIRDDSCLSREDFLEAHKNDHVCYKLAESYTIQLTSEQITALVGDNTIWSDANGDIEVEYRADTGLFLKQNTVKDVQLNGTSILNDGVANLPLMSWDKLGVAKVSNNYGLTMGSTGGQFLQIDGASQSTVKAGGNSFAPITPSHQHEAAFYGLAKVAGADMAESSNAVGTYTDAAKQSIQKLFGFENILGTYESSTTASKAYTVGETFIFNGKRYRVTADIAQGYVINPGTNCELDPIDGHYVRDTDIAGTEKLGLVMVNPNWGVTLESGTGKLYINAAPSTLIKSGTNAYRSIVPGRQHESVFYALAKLAGADMASLTGETVGVYPQAQKDAILAMLGAVGENDYATDQKAGIAKVSNAFGLQMTNNSEVLAVQMAGLNEIKSASNYYKPIVPASIHQAAFFGLSKAAGVDLANETVTVGTYPTNAKTAIQTMLGIEANIPLIEEVSGSAPTIIGMPNVRYICGEVTLLTITPPAAGSIVVRFSTGSSTTLTVPDTVKWPAWFDATSLDADTTYEIIITDGVYGGVTSWA